MLLTEKDAREKWCPFVRIFVTGAIGTTILSDGPMNRMVVQKQDGEMEYSHSKCGSNCIASECMAWRWAEPAEQTHTILAGEDTPEGDGWEARVQDEHSALWVRQRPDRHGFCGLAGSAP